MIAVALAALVLSPGSDARAAPSASSDVCIFPTPQSDGPPPQPLDCSLPPSTGSPTQSSAGPLRGPATVEVGERAHFSLRTGTSASSAYLCYRPGTARLTCLSTGSSWYVTIRPGRLQYVTLRQSGAVIGRLIYREGSLVTHR